MAAVAANHPRDHIDRTSNFLTETPKNCLKAMKLTGEWAKVFFENLKNNPELKLGLSTIGIGTALFVFPEYLGNLNDLKNTVSDWSGGRATFKKLAISLGDVVGKTCEVGKWLFETKIIALSTIVASRLTMVNGASMMFGFSSKIISIIKDLQVEGITPDKRAIKMWKLAKYTALFALSVLITAIGYAGYLNPAAMLICSTVSLITTYAQYILEHPFAPPVNA